MTSTPEGKFTYEWIAGRTANDGYFRIADAHDNAVGFCYSAHNAVLLTDALNAAVSERGDSLAAVIREIANWPDEDNEWDAVEKYRKIRDLAKKALPDG